MKMKFCSLLAGASLLALAGTANAAQPLTDTQMDRVTAGAAALGVTYATAWGDLDAFTATDANAYTNAFAHIANANTYAAGSAVSAAFIAYAATSGSSRAALP